MQPLSPVGLDPPGIQPKPFMHALPCPFPFPGAQTPEDMTDGKNHGPTGLAAAAWQGPTATHLLDVHQLRLVDLGDRNVVFRRNGESALGGT